MLQHYSFFLVCRIMVHHHPGEKPSKLINKPHSSPGRNNMPAHLYDPKLLMKGNCAL
jgi:hypothetical protein